MTEDDWTASLTKGPGLKIWATMGAAFRSFPGLVRALPFFIVWTIVLISAADVLLVNGLYEVGIREFDAGLGGGNLCILLPCCVHIFWFTSPHRRSS
jgi:hypothetical protein